MRTLVEVAKEIGMPLDTLLKMRNSIAKEPVQRLDTLSWEHHAALVTDDGPRPDTMFWLLLCEHYGWSVEHLKETIT